MAKSGYILQTGAAVALTAATAKTVLMAIAPSSFGIDLTKIRVGFDGTTAANAPVRIELVTSTNATNSTPGTGNTSATPTQIYGRTITPGITGFYNATSEPTVLTAIDSWYLTPVGGVLWYDYPLGTSVDTAVSTGIGLRMTAPAGVNVLATMTMERC